MCRIGKMKMGIIALGLVFFLAACTTTAEKDTGEDEYVRIPLSDLSGEVTYHEIQHEGTTIRFITVLGSDGLPRTAFDACDVCGGKKGYEQVGHDIRCRNCGRVFAIDGLGEKNKGYGCWPSYISHEVQGEYLVIKKREMEEGISRFM